MTKLYRILLILFIVLCAVLVYIIVRQSRTRVDYLASEVSADSITSYETRADSLGRAAEVLEADLGSLSGLAKASARRRLDGLRGEIAALRTAIERWRAARTPEDNNQAYRECILLYGKASGICEGLSTDVPPDSEK